MFHCVEYYRKLMIAKTNEVCEIVKMSLMRKSAQGGILQYVAVVCVSTLTLTAWIF
jgi:hypothetical protein